MNKYLIGITLIILAIFLAACGGADIPTETPAPTSPPPPPPTPPPTVPPTESPDRCSYYEGLDFSIVVYSIAPEDSSVLMYTQFPGQVIGLEDGMDDGLPWDYFAILGEQDSLECRMFEGEVFQGRLYCAFPLPKEYRGTSRRFALQVNECAEVIYEVPLLSLMVDESSAGGGSGGSSGGGYTRFCGFNPGATCSSAFESWCDCKGGTYSCVDPSINAAVCWLP